MSGSPKRSKGMLVAILWFVCGIAVLAVALKIAFPLPARDDFPPDLPVPLAESELATSLAGMPENDGQASGIFLLPVGIDAFAMRLALVRNAAQTIDAQYYIWEDDLSGRMLLQEIVAAADRGVRVRILIDDNPTAGLDGMWTAINSHPNISVRIYNPLTIRAVRPANYLFDFFRLNRRMHNKSFTVDGVATVVGGRNVGDPYFGASDDTLFIDLDALGVGAVVPAVSQQFQIYWDSEPVYPAARILAKPSGDAIDAYRAPRYPDSALADAYRDAAQGAMAKLQKASEAESPLIWSQVELVYDDPAKGLAKVKNEDLMITRLAGLIGESRKSFDLVSGYFVPTRRGEALLGGLAKRGVETKVVTNSFQVTDVPLVHAGYAPSRKPLLRDGVILYEAKPQAPGAQEASSLGATRFSGGGESVHAKSFVIDDRKLFVGSFNFDPRSAVLNCEMGFVIDAPELASAVSQGLDRRMPQNSYRLGLDDGEISWTEVGEKARVHGEEPGTTAFSRFMVWLLSQLPIAWLL